MFGKLVAYLDSIRKRDPAPRSRWEVLIYPGVLALGMHRIAHRLFTGELYFLARLVNHISRFLTAIDIHPGAQIGSHLFIDHGFTVIGETSVIGDNVTIYQCVTLGGTNPANGKGGKRHPTLENDVIIGSGAQILGPIIVGKRARVGANAVVTEDVPEGATMVGVKARSTLMPAETWARDFVPYGTPCSKKFDPKVQRLEILQCEIEQIQKQLDALMAERGKSGLDVGGSGSAGGEIENTGADAPTDIASHDAKPPHTSTAPASDTDNLPAPRKRSGRGRD